MILAEPLQGFGITLRSVEADDAAFILEQRLAARARPFLGDTSPDVAHQRAWIAAQRVRAEDLYLLAHDAQGEPLGTIGLYNRQGTVAEWGRFVVRPGVKAAPACLYLLLDYGFAQAGLQQVYCVTLADNARAIAFYERAGLVPDPIPAPPATVAGVTRPCVRHTLDRARYKRMREAFSPPVSVAAGRNVSGSILLL